MNPTYREMLSPLSQVEMLISEQENSLLMQPREDLS
jgi:hypothetical protein